MYLLDSRLSLSLEEGEQPLCLVVVCSMGGGGFVFVFGEVLSNTGRKKELSLELGFVEIGRAHD